MRTQHIESTDVGLTFEQYMEKRFPLISKNLFYTYLRKKCFKINGIHVRTGKEVLQADDLLSFFVDDKYFAKGSQRESAIEILFEDEQMMVANKPEGLLSHPDEKLHEEDLLTVLAKEKGVPFGTYSLANRLDFNTSGLIIIGKNPLITRALNDAAMRDQIKKYYRCLVVGYLEKPKDELHAWLLKDEVSALVRISNVFLPKSQEIITKYQVLDEGNGLSLLEIELLTGKTHQIRAHFAAIDHPVLGDPLYGNERLNKRFGVAKQALWASKLTFAISDPQSPLFGMNGKTIVKDEPYWNIFLQVAKARPNQE